MLKKLIKTDRKTDLPRDLGQDGVISPLTAKKARQFTRTGTLERRKRHVLKEILYVLLWRNNSEEFNEPFNRC